MEPSSLALFWAAVVCVSILVYVILDGFDLGVGVVFGTVREEAVRVEMMNAIAPVWNGNETWLVVIGTSLFAAFPAAYVVFMGAYYIPVLLLLFGLIFRGVAFEFRFRTERMRPIWDWGFFLGSTAMAFVQGTAVAQ
jgi:cytochrome bd ubiquinol oxidase subunit II